LVAPFLMAAALQYQNKIMALQYADNLSGF
jgi:hypothetical protein